MSRKSKKPIKNFTIKIIAVYLIVFAVLAGVVLLTARKMEKYAPAEDSQVEAKAEVTTEPAIEVPEEPKHVVDKNDEYLILVNKTHELSSDYEPEDLVDIKYRATEKNFKLRQVARDAIDQMFEAAEKDGLTIRAVSAYRSYEYQAGLYERNVKNKGEEHAKKFSAQPGQSEHQTGLACDVSCASEGWAVEDTFGSTPEGQWIKEHCHEYGFIVRYTDGTATEIGEITGYAREPWHIRYVGVENATYMYENNLILEEYLDEVDVRY